MPLKGIEETAISQVNGHGVDGEITPPEVGLYGQRMIKRDLKVTVSYPRRDFCAWERHVYRSAVPAMRQEFDDPKRTPRELHAPICPSTTEQVWLRQTSDQEVQVFAGLPQQCIPHCASNRIHARTPLLECAHERKGSWRRRHNYLGIA